MGVVERDPYTGHATTGHEWNGIKELNTAVPRLVWVFLAIAVLFSVVWWILMPAWPLGTTYTKGVLQTDTRREVASELSAAVEARSPWTSRIEKEDFATIQADPALMEYVREAGHALFGDNCAACHGIEATGGPGFPNLADDAWLWGGTSEAVFETIRVGVNADHARSRRSLMPAWGKDQLLDEETVNRAVDYVYLQSHPEATATISTERAAAGRKVFATYCAACHGVNATGNTMLGAPNLVDSFWLYGGDRKSIYTTVYGGRQGHMPTWEERLSLVDRKVLTLYVIDRTGQRQ